MLYTKPIRLLTGDIMMCRRFVFRHCGLYRSMPCFYVVPTLNTLPTTNVVNSFLTPLPNRTTIYNYVKRFRATGSVPGNITYRRHVLGKICTRSEDKGRQKKIRLHLHSKRTCLRRPHEVLSTCRIYIHTSRKAFWFTDSATQTASKTDL